MNKLQIINAALHEVTDTSIQSLDERLGKRIDETYEPLVEALMYGTAWSWAVQRGELQLVRDDAPGSYHYQYQLPTQQGVVAVYRQDYDYPITEGYTRRGPFLFASFNPVWADYKDRVAEERFPALFRRAVILSLAASIAMLVQEDVNTATLKMREAENALSLARADEGEGVVDGGIDLAWAETRRIVGIREGHYGIGTGAVYGVNL